MDQTLVDLLSKALINLSEQAFPKQKTQHPSIKVERYLSQVRHEELVKGLATKLYIQPCPLCSK